MSQGLRAAEAARKGGTPGEGPPSVSYTHLEYPAPRYPVPAREVTPQMGLKHLLDTEGPEAVSHMNVDVQELGCDLYALSLIHISCDAAGLEVN